MIRLYGQTRGYSSIAVVLAGFRQALQAEGLLGGVYGCDLDYDQEDAPGGVIADTAVYLGVPWDVATPRQRGRHREVWGMLTPNSDTLPDRLVERYEANVTGYLAASTYARDVIRKYTKKEIILTPHGVGAEMVRYPGPRSRTLLHFSTSALSRKGTLPLLEAWAEVVSAGDHRDHELVVVVDAAARAAVFESLIAKGRKHLERVRLMDRGFGAPLGANPVTMARALSAAAFVVQPSRAEGFGLIPLEARACGTPVIQTLVTGHRDHLPEAVKPWRWGVVEVEAGGDDTESDDWPGALAPEVTVGAVYSALLEALEQHAALTRAAEERAVDVRAQWTWRRQLTAFLERGEKNAV